MPNISNNLSNRPLIPIESNLRLLPPGIERTREILEILNDPRLHALLRDVEIIERIEKTENGYLIQTDNFSVTIHVNYLPPSHGCMGPAQIELEFEEPIHRGDFHILPYPPTRGSLSPSAQRVREWTCLLSDHRLLERLGSLEMIERIEKTENGYLIVAQSCTILVEVIYHDSDRLNPIPFDLEFPL